MRKTLIVGGLAALTLISAGGVAMAQQAAKRDADGDGRISRAEAQANPALADEFDALDSRHSGYLTREQLAGWLTP